VKPSRPDAGGILGTAKLKRALLIRIGSSFDQCWALLHVHRVVAASKRGLVRSGH
jgi:hypothetical protein